MSTMPGARRSLVVGLLLLLLPAAGVACLWDYDTLLQERTRFPSTLELITGKFLRHSPEFYQWRIKDRLEKLKADPDNLAYRDDLAVAYDKTGQDDKAIEVMLESAKRKPGRYETEANLGTFYVHAGRPDKGLEHIKHALALNPDAHFGREKYQKLLVEYVQTRRRGGKVVLPLGEDRADHQGPTGTFLEHLSEHPEGPSTEPRLPWPQRKAAIKGVLGMMRFGHYDSPVLLEALGSLLGDADDDLGEQDAKFLASRAYLKASYEARDEGAKASYRRWAGEVLKYTAPPGGESDERLAKLEKSFRQELTDARQWFGEVRRKELEWIRQGKDADKEYARLYYEEPEVESPDRTNAVFKPTAPAATTPPPQETADIHVRSYILAASVAALVAVLAVLRWLRNRAPAQFMPPGEQ
jgi:tetratricopeptide (TPR) repeat protein